MMKAKQMHALVKVQQPFSNVVKPEEVVVAAIHIIDTKTIFVKLCVKRITEPRPDMKKRKEARGIQATSMTQPGANSVVVVWRDGLKYVQHGYGEFEHVVGTP